MDGLKKRLNGSVRYRLSFSLSVTVIAIALAAGAFSFVSAFNQAEELQDDALIQIAALADQSAPRWTPAAGGTELKDSDNDSSVYLQTLGAAASAQPHRTPLGKMPVLPATLADGLHTIDWERGAYRVLVKTIHTGDKIAVLQETSARDDTAYRSALNTLLPFLILVPVLLFLIAQLIRKIFRPITELSRQIDARAENDLRPVRDAHLPSEIRPFVLAINRLLARVAEAVNIQRRFVADAAHELRSPLTALSLQAERLEHLPMSDSARERLHILEDGIQRAARLLNQLLSLSKAQTAAGQADAEISIRDIYRLVLEDLMPLAKAKHIDLGVLHGPDLAVRAKELDLYTMVKNLVDNAIRYTPAGGRVDLSAEASPQGTAIRVVDTGPGIPLTERERIFDPFHRILGTEQVGSGLGLAIVKAIAERLNAGIQLDFADSAARTGLAITITIPGPEQA
ncbi:ATP-binding protein [Candidimonas nitroreducens]|uniref:histidine kinase n=1 Tax=Candidimonas nitroreducens TaxID=683354 RepID=A0A225M6A7_9BURK|nr:ATP-binding protein [Candidimonas nitroreducens]OWT56857.1 two-component sensor histidine kinase [Candidimonas nitroreducens]